METELKKEVGDLLFETGKLTSAQLDLVRRRQQRLRIPQHRALVQLNYCTEEDTYRALAALNALEFYDLTGVTLPQALLDQVPVKLIFHYHMVPVKAEDDTLTLAFSEPPRSIDLGNLRLVLG
ncbi:MAG: type II/IV secretion system protein, partial [Verrucomicrobiota bacterium]